MPPVRKRSDISIAVVMYAIIAVYAACAAYESRYMWDDGAVYLIEREGGPDALANAWADRPFVGWQWALMARTGLLWELLAFTRAGAWWAMGMCSFIFARRVLPRSARWLAILGGLHAISPAITSIQHVFNIVHQCLLPSVLSFAGALAVSLPRFGGHPR
jgi:hypothetical protein